MFTRDELVVLEKAVKIWGEQPCDGCDNCGTLYGSLSYKLSEALKPPQPTLVRLGDGELGTHIVIDRDIVGKYGSDPQITTLVENQICSNFCKQFSDDINWLGHRRVIIYGVRVQRT